MKVGWSGPFPPHKSGGAALTYWFVSEMVKKRDIEVYGYPTIGELLPSVRPPIDPSRLDAFIFYYSPALREAKSLKERVLIVAHHGFDNIMRTPEEFANFLSIADVVIATDMWEKKLYEEAGLKNVKVVPYGVDTSVFIPRPKKPPIEILYCGRLLVYKGFLQVIEAMNRVLEKHGDVRFRVHGYIDTNWEGDTEIAKALTKLQRKYGTRVVLEHTWTLPWEMPQVYEGAHILLFPSGRASFGIPLVEAMSMEIPVITTSYGSHGEVVGDAGIRLEPKVEVQVREKWRGQGWVNTVPCIEDIFDAVTRLVEDEALRSKLGEEGRKRVKEKFENKDVVDKLVKVCREGIEEIKGYPH
jgi:glycosyltransferase involved in cell wall biosynthesis